MTEQKRLGRGLEALLARTQRAPAAPAGGVGGGTGTGGLGVEGGKGASSGAATADPGNRPSSPGAAVGAPAPTAAPSLSGLASLRLGEIRPNPYQPRKEFSEEELADLEASLRVNGLLQPITVRRAPNGAAGYELIAGERRFRAAQRLGWSEIPAIIKEELDDKTALTLALVENLQRADLNPIEEAEGYQQLMAEFALTQQEVADIVAKNRATVANMLRLLALPASVRRQVRDGELDLGHARALLGLGDATKIADLARVVVAEGLSVREVERRVREAVPQRARPSRPTPAKAADAANTRDPHVKSVETELRRYLQTDVRIDAQGGTTRGEVRIAFYSADDLERVLDLILGARRETL